MKKLLSLPPNLVGSFHDITGLSRAEYFCAHDPLGRRVGSGGGTIHLLEQCWLSEGGALPFEEWLSAERRILVHAGGQSRRLPAYAPSGKVLTPIPVFRWERGQRLGQTLLDLQLPIYERLMRLAPPQVHTMVVSGDVYIRAAEELPPMPEADVVCYGLWTDDAIAKDHGVFVIDRDRPGVLRQMLQKPSLAQLGEVAQTAYYLTDIGVWVLSDRAVQVLARQTGRGESIRNYNLYADFGLALGTHPQIDNEEVRALTVAIVPLPQGRFFHFGTSRKMISSMLAVQNEVDDQREIMHHDRKPHPSIFTQNTRTDLRITADNINLWGENCHIGRHWTISHDNIITGVPLNDWELTLTPGQCIDIVPVGEHEWVVRPYHMDDCFEGAKQQMRLYPVVDNVDDMGCLARLMIEDNPDVEPEAWLGHLTRTDGTPYAMMSADEISDQANLRRLFAQRHEFARANWPALAKNYRHSVFYQLDLDDAAREFADQSIPLPAPLSDDNDETTQSTRSTNRQGKCTTPLLTRTADAMFRSEVMRRRGQDGSAEANRAFSLLRQGLTEAAEQKKQRPRLSVYTDQIVWGRSPVRIDIAGGWTDTPPYCLMEGGAVINLAIELNGQPPLQTFIKPCREPHIVLRSIDLGATEVVSTYEELADMRHVGSPFAIPKAALALAGFLPGFSAETYPSLRAQLLDFGGGIELTLLSAIPAGSGLGTSSILAATVLGAVSDFCSLCWDKNEIGQRTLALEQMLTTGGGWQDQFGGLHGGIKLLQTNKGLTQSPLVRWLPDDVYTNPEYARCHLLYYTGLTRTAKTILGEIVRRMFLNQGEQLRLLREMKAHTMEMREAIQRRDFHQVGRLIAKTWQQNQALDCETNPPAVRKITDMVSDLCLGYKLPGAGGGGYVYMVAKDPEAAARIVKTLNDRRMDANARFVEMMLCRKGFQVSRS